MASVPVKVRRSYAAPSLCRDSALVWAFHERRGPYRTPHPAGDGSPGSITPRRHVAAAVSSPVGLHLKPGQKGTKHLVEQYGDHLVCVRYRYDATRKKRIKTVELVVGEADWQPRFPPDEIVALRVAFTDVVTRSE
jgi:hypothetical protein